MELSNKLTGMVDSSDGPVLFICDGFQFLFLTDRTVDWFTTADLIISAYAKYTYALNNFVIPKEFRLSNEGVYALIKHRNDVTHGRMSEITKQKLYTALQVMALTYCCILDAAEFPQDTVEKIMQKGILKPN